MWVDGGGRHWLVQMEYRPAGWLVYLPPLIFPCTIKSRSSLLALAQPGGLGKRAVKWLCVYYYYNPKFQDTTCITIKQYNSPLALLITVYVKIITYVFCFTTVVILTLTVMLLHR